MISNEKLFPDLHDGEEWVRAMSISLLTKRFSEIAMFGNSYLNIFHSVFCKDVFEDRPINLGHLH